MENRTATSFFIVNTRTGKRERLVFRTRMAAQRYAEGLSAGASTPGLYFGGTWGEIKQYRAGNNG